MNTRHFAAVPTPQVPQDWTPVYDAQFFPAPVDLAAIVQRAMDGDRLAIDTLTEWDGQDEPPVGDDR